ncbi:MAG: DUF4249 family protein [Bacteroidota bacterium]
MRRDYLSFFTFLLLITMITSCEVVVEMEEDSQIIVQSYFSQDQDLIVYVTESFSIGSNKPERIVENASVGLYNGDDLTFITTLQLSQKIGEESFYTTVDFQPEINTPYKLSVDVPGFSPIHAINSIPDTVSHVVELVDNSVTVFDEGSTLTVDFEVDVMINDPYEDENYYHILFFQELIEVQLGVDGQPVVDTILMDKQDLFIQPSSKSLSIQQIPDEPSFILNDKELNGENINIRFTGHYNYDKNLYQKGEFLIEMRTVTQAYYEHMKSLTSKPLPGVIDNNNYYYSGNVTNAGGYFLGYSSSYKRLQFLF